jgi:hypothetical protein
MSSTPEQAATPTGESPHDRIAKRLQERTKPRACVVCGVTQWSLGYYVTLPAVEAPGELRLGGQNYPLIALVCGNCGNTHLLNLLILGFTAEEWESMKIPFPQ